MTPEQIAKLPYRPCVGLMLMNDRGKIFVGQRNDRFEDAWQMPQGGVDEGESPREAALRELQEEIGVTPDLVEIVAETDGWLPYDLPHDIVPKIWKGRYRGQQQKWFLLRFLGTDDQIDIQTDHPEFTRWKWQDPDRLIAEIVPFKREVYERVMEAFGGYLG
ncbi:putative (di)nucleoside polyphosphate hydrolase [Ruegeria intermedia]|uniref:RNA pyrophosphohydrolase n=1 Tax=Ruegeria intermedia TaxID=996115 RepID=A0A1M4STP0_9RHOB|nr:RNA pyrophosphohydrolase [Ruegeria intermedia]SHE35624.1 putative (di)nucleoside polyphosphate hydrolase [Ruegeria intermedia]